MRIKRVLIVNRGEIALRIMRSLWELDLEPVIAYSAEDRESLPVKLAKEKICIGKGASKDSYLNIPNIISAATLLKVDAIHPGYGFLSENPMFAKIVSDYGISFIGPSYKTLSIIKDKAEIRKIAKDLGIPILPGTVEPLNTVDEAKAIARKIGYPIAVKASRGGGGKGIRVIFSEAELEKNFKIAQSEAQTSFGSNSLYIEKYLERPRHIEVQIVADKFGNTFSLGTRECSIQRNRQKVIEEAQAIVLDTKVKDLMINDAVKFAKAINYSNVGTVEFLYSEGSYYLMEMNARIQVEHTVTEEITGIDMVKLQLQIEENNEIDLSNVKFNGHSIEMRINAEDPFNNFMPSSGKITNLNFPQGRNVRVDSFIYDGYFLPPLYDSLIAKVVVKGSTREETIHTAKRAINEFKLEGIKTNIPLLKKILDSTEFTQNKIYTTFLEEFISESKKSL